MRVLVNLARLLPSTSSQRLICLSAGPRLTQYDVRAFTDPITDLDELSRPLSEDDQRNFLFLKAMKSDDTPVFYRNKYIDALTRICMKSGQKELIRKKVYAALELVKRSQYKLWLKANDEEKKSIEMDPFVIAEKAVTNCRPLMKIQGVTRGGTTYQVPFPISESESIFRAMKTIRDVCRTKAKHGAMHFEQILANELLGAAKNEGFSIQAKQELHKLCEANRAYAHYRG